MANINETISEIEKLNPELARQVKKFVKDHSYGLVFERNLPEEVRLYTKKPAVGDVVNIRPERGCEETGENKIAYAVKEITYDVAVIEREGETKTVSCSDLVPVVSYKDTIYAGLKEIDRVERGNPDDPYHMVINAENYHALEMLTYAYTGKVDCIYIDPPYNTGAKDWKYNNDYVDATDKYKHSKWLAFMERRLKLAKKLLNPNDSVLIVTIDEKEYLHLGCLLEQIFPEAYIQMVTIVNNPKGSTRGRFSRVEEYAYFCFLGVATVTDQVDSMLGESINREDGAIPRWKGLLKSGTSGARREDSQNLFYPILIDKSNNRIVRANETLPLEIVPDIHAKIDGYDVAWPIREDGSFGRWMLSYDTFNDMLSKGFISLGRYDSKRHTWGFTYLTSKYLKEIEDGKLTITGYSSNGQTVIVQYLGASERRVKTVWHRTRHDAGAYGTDLIGSILCGARFTFPKSVMAVKDTLQCVVMNKPNALIIDFFAGSGTTLHAVNLLNAEDGGHRRCISITNNEVSDDEQKAFTAKGLRQGDPGWEQYGIANYVTWARTKCSIEGVDVNGKPLEGNYGCETEVYSPYEGEVTDPDTGKKVRGKLYKKIKQASYPELAKLNMADGFKANAIFCELTYESAWNIRLDQAFDAIAPVLWMLAGCQGPIIRKVGEGYLTTDYYGVLFDYGQASKFCTKVKSTPTIKTVFVATDDQRRYSNMCSRLAGIEVHRLYESFLKTFEICGEGGLD